MVENATANSTNKDNSKRWNILHKQSYKYNKSKTITKRRSGMLSYMVNEMEMETSKNNEEYKINNELTHQDESWKVVTSNKKRKITPGTSATGNLDTEKQRWLHELPLRNSFSSLNEEIDADPTSEITTHPTHIAKPPPIFVEAQIIDPLINLLNNILIKNSYIFQTGYSH